MKKKRLLFILVLGINFGLYAQKLQKKDVFSVSKISDFLNDFNDDQTQKTTTAIEVRKKEIEEAGGLEEKILANKKYYTQLVKVLTEAQEQRLFGEFVDKDAVKNQTESVSTSFNVFPLKYQNWVMGKLFEFNYKVQYVNNKYPFDLKQKNIEKSKVLSKKRQFLKSQTVLIRELRRIVNEIERACPEISKEEYNALRDYHFYVLKDPVKYTLEINNLLKSDVFVNAKQRVVDSFIVRKINNNNFISEQDSIIQERVKNLVSNKMLDQIKRSEGDRKVLRLTSFDNQSLKIAYEKVKKDQNKKKEKKEKELFITKAKKVGLNDDKIKKILLLIDERNSAISAYRESLKNGSNQDLFSLTDASEVKKPALVKKEFSKQLGNLLSYNEFFKLIGSDFKKKSIEQTNKEITKLFDSKELTKEQDKELYQLVFTHYYHQNITKVYYDYDKQLLRQKLGVLTYRFEKEYNALAKKFDLDTSATKKINNRTFQWN